ncbi:AFG2-interacting ribosome maturation factor-like isoform X2 [Ornithodoros turicata]|uniref:AFG2-interacting ribosome maturation factor-like isoform X2 n=1 Tax=Ornithodoros turicata TaxID=34597 RepID=UPI0031390EE3
MGDLTHPLDRHFRQVFNVIEQMQGGTWKKVMEGSHVHLAELSTLMEIFSNCSVANINSTKTASRFPDVKDRILRKVTDEMTDKKAALANLLNALRRSHTSVSNACQQALQAYCQASEKLSVIDVCQRTELYPSIADMIEWLSKIDQQFSNKFAKEFLLENLQFSQDLGPEKFVGEWKKEDSTVIMYLNEVLWALKFFMTAKA